MPAKDRVLADAIKEMHGFDPLERDLTFEQVIQEWREARWPKPGGPEVQDTWDALKLTGEAGEAGEAVTKITEGRRDEQHLADELGDVLIAASVLAGRHGWTLDDLRADRWEEVQNR